MKEIKMKDVTKFIELIGKTLDHSKQSDGPVIYAAFICLLVGLGGKLGITKQKARSILGKAYDSYNEYKDKQDVGAP